MDIKDKRKENFFHICHLLLNGGTVVLREQFDKYCPPSDLQAILQNERAKLHSLYTKKKISPHGWEKLYPPPDRSPASKKGEEPNPSSDRNPTSKGFDITMLFLLLRNVCKLQPPSLTGSWDLKPLPEDKSKEADFVRINYYRNKLYAHAKESLLTDVKYEKYRDKIIAVLVRLGGDKSELEKMLTTPLSNEHQLEMITTQLVELKSSIDEIKDSK